VPGTFAAVRDLDLTADPSRFASGDVGGHRLRRAGHVQVWVARVIVQPRPIWGQNLRSRPCSGLAGAVAGR